MKTPLTYTRRIAEAMRNALIEEKGYTDEDLPCTNTVGNILNRMGYSLKRVLKTKPVKKITEVDEVFENVWTVNLESDKNPELLRISIDAKAKVKVGESTESVIIRKFNRQNNNLCQVKTALAACRCFSFAVFSEPLEES